MLRSNAQAIHEARQHPFRHRAKFLAHLRETLATWQYRTEEPIHCYYLEMGPEDIQCGYDERLNPLAHLTEAGTAKLFAFFESLPKEGA